MGQSTRCPLNFLNVCGKLWCHSLSLYQVPLVCILHIISCILCTVVVAAVVTDVVVDAAGWCCCCSYCCQVGVADDAICHGVVVAVVVVVTAPAYHVALLEHEVKHMMHNLSEDIMSALPCFDEYFKLLKGLEPLISQRWSETFLSKHMQQHTDLDTCLVRSWFEISMSVRNLGYDRGFAGTVWKKPCGIRC